MGEPTFTNYEAAAEYQLREWAEGRPWHNPWSPGAVRPGDGECCPDFSCCVPEMIWARERRYAFVAAGPEERDRMLMGALSGLVTGSGAIVIGDGDGEND